MADICMVGWWHQAMVYGAGLADLGHRVVGVCDSAQTAERLNAGDPVVYEPGLPALMRRNIRRGRLRFTTDYAAALAKARFAYISIDTPVLQGDRSEISPIVEAARQIGRHRQRDLVLCVTAQVPIGSCAMLGRLAGGSRGVVQVAYVPEFLRLGSAIETFRKADRFVVGCDDPPTARRVAGLYAALGRPVVTTDLLSAEMAKHACNAFLATSISFINEIADLCEETGANASTVARVMKLDRRIGPYAFLAPGLGFAGGTLGREIRALQRIGRAAGVPTTLLNAVGTVNGRRAARVVSLLDHELAGLRGKRVAVLGLTYKPGTSTLRRAVALDIIRALNGRGASVSAFDPRAERRDVPGDLRFEWAASPYAAAAGSHAVVLVTEWPEFARLTPARLRRAMKTPLVFDTKGVLNERSFTAAGFKYLAIGRPHAARRP